MDKKCGDLFQGIFRSEPRGLNAQTMNAAEVDEVMEMIAKLAELHAKAEVLKYQIAQIKEMGDKHGL